MFRGLTTVNLDVKGRLAVPVRFREQLSALDSPALVLTLNPWDRALWLYPLPEWQLIETKLSALSDFDKQSRRTKQMMRGYATDVSCDGQGRILLSPELRDIAALDKQVVLLGQGNKIEIWDATRWRDERDEWLDDVGTGAGTPSTALETLAL
ncbi:MAG: division/cell wall cluster transcriptional repressor MraZ [Gammaproteobacteria bacterium]|nr:division/cell wall cluster transcriptional repressor MraZ [Gammaproteobacteria bacterium]